MWELPVLPCSGSCGYEPCTTAQLSFSSTGHPRMDYCFQASARSLEVTPRSREVCLQVDICWPQHGPTWVLQSLDWVQESSPHKTLHPLEMLSPFTWGPGPQSFPSPDRAWEKCEKGRGAKATTSIPQFQSSGFRPQNIINGCWVTWHGAKVCRVNFQSNAEEIICTITVVNRGWACNSLHSRLEIFPMHV